MPPIIHCVRHAQAIHNLSVANHVIPDPILTDLGNEQCRKLREKFPYHSDVELVVSSPLRRTIATSLQGFEPVFQSREGLKLIVHPDLQETSDVPCDTGSNPEVLREEIEKGGLPVDLGLLFDGWNSKKGPYAPTNKEIKNRARAARRWLKARPEKVIVVVTHGGFLHYFTEDWEDSSEYQGTGWANTEFRTFEFADVEHKDDLEGYGLDGDNATLIETVESRRRRGKDGTTPSREQQKVLYKLGVQGWDNQGLALSVAEREKTKVPQGEEAQSKQSAMRNLDAGFSIEKE
nr:CtnF [Monascus aurantiacus]